MPERTNPISKILKNISEWQSGDRTLKEFKEYDTRLRGREDSSYGRGGFIDKKGGSVVFIGSPKTGLPIVMRNDHLNEFVKEACWLKDPWGTKQAFWHLSAGIKDYDLGIREMKKENIYFDGAHLFIPLKESLVEVQQIGFGYDFGGIHYLNSSNLKASGAEFGLFNKRLLADFITNKSGTWGRLKEW